MEFIVTKYNLSGLIRAILQEFNPSPKDGGLIDNLINNLNVHKGDVIHGLKAIVCW